MKKENLLIRKILTFSMIVIILIGQVSNAAGFTDVKTDKWYYNDIKAIEELGIINGYEDNTYRPENTITRIEALKIVVESINDKNIESMPDQDNWYTKYLIYGISVGIDINDFNTPISRKEIAEYIVKVYKKGTVPTQNLLADTKDVYMERLYEDGIIAGVGLKDNKPVVNPNGYLKRAEMAALINRMVNKPIVKPQVPEKSIVAKSNLPKDIMKHKVNKPTTQEQFEAEILDMIEKREFSRKTMFESRRPNDVLLAFYQEIDNAYFSMCEKYPEYMGYVNTIHGVFDDDSMGLTIFLAPASKANKSPGEMLDIFELEAIKVIENLKREGKITETQTQKEKARAIYTWIVQNTVYIDNDSPEVSLGYGQILNGEAVCQGYTASYNYLLRLVGIENVKGMVGYADNGLHTWTEAILDGQRVIIDATWGDPVPDQGQEVQYKYFDIDEMELRKTHSWGNPY